MQAVVGFSQVTSARISDDEFSSPCIPRISSGRYELDVREDRSALIPSEPFAFTPVEGTGCSGDFDVPVHGAKARFEMRWLVGDFDDSELLSII